MRMRNGYTLIELLAVMVVFIVIATFIVTILTTSLRGNNKANTLTLVRENGNFVITQMAKDIREAHAVITPYPCGTVDSPVTSTKLGITTVSGDTIVYKCVSNNIASNGANLLDANNITVNSCSFSCGQVSPANPPVVSIDFSLSAKTASTFTEFTASASALPFDTSVILRNTNL